MQSSRLSKLTGVFSLYTKQSLSALKAIFSLHSEHSSPYIQSSLLSTLKAVYPVRYALRPSRKAVIPLHPTNELAKVNQQLYRCCFPQTGSTFPQLGFLRAMGTGSEAIINAHELFVVFRCCHCNLSWHATNLDQSNKVYGC